MNMSQNEILIRIQETPNPSAWKFVINKTVLTDGKATYSNIAEAENNILAKSLFQIPGIKQVHFFQNVITVTHTFDADIEEIHKAVSSVIQTRMPVHNPQQTIKDEKKIAREKLSPELQRIEQILDDTIRPGLQGDGGDLTVLNLDGNKLYVNYEGACGTCPSATSGTLMAIEGILRDHLQHDIEVIPV